MDSILGTVKKLLGISDEDRHFDKDVIVHINSSFMTLNQLGVGPEYGFAIEDESSTWNDFVEDIVLINAVKTYVYLYVATIFDPPASSFVLTAMKEQMKEIEWRLMAMVEKTEEVKVDDEQ